MFKAYTQSRQDDDYERLLQISANIYNRLCDKALNERLTDCEMVVMVQISTVIGELDHGKSTRG